MKQCCRYLAALLLLCLSFALPARAETPWSEDYYRATDATHSLTAAEQEELDEACIEFMKRFQADLVLLAVRTEDYDGFTLREASSDYYEDCGFGYGETKDGFFLVYDAELKYAEIYCYGDAEKLIAQERLDSIAALLPHEESATGVYGLFRAAVETLTAYADVQPAAPAAGAGKTARTDGGSGLPTWYPADTEHFAGFHDPDAPRVVDNADLFTDADAQRMEARLAVLREELEKDIVIYTDVTAYGMEHAYYAADFYDYNGYGIGENYEGACLFICMDPEDRGWWVCCTGPVSEELYTEDNANDLDDVLYEYMVDGRYAEGVSDWIENIRTMYLKGNPFAPEWMPGLGETYTRTHRADAPRVTDDTGRLTAEERSALEARAAEIAQKYGLDVAVHVTASTVGLELRDYAEQFYYYNGYGFGEDYDGLLLTVYHRGVNDMAVELTASGKGDDRLTDVNRERLLKKAWGEMVYHDGDYDGLSNYLDRLDHMERTGRVARSTGYWIWIAALALLAGSIFGSVTLNRAKKKMAQPKEQGNANSYLVPGMLTINRRGTAFLYRTQSRRYSPVREEKTESSSSTRSYSSSHSRSSSYSKSYSSSSGRSHTGSGRKF